MVRVGLDVMLENLPPGLRGKSVGVLCHAASVTSRLTHILDELAGRGDCRVSAVFGPQHGLFGQTQDNMIEWEGGYLHPRLRVPVYSLYGRWRKPTPAMLEGLDALVVDLQDVGARPYTYVWTMKLCLEACAEHGIPLWVLDRPNPIAALGFDGPVLREDFFSFVGGACIPLCHRMTMAEMARLIRDAFVPRAELHWVSMKQWWRNSLWAETGLPWVLPSPNMPTPDTATVYPGMVLLEATNLSEGRGTTRPFELFGAPYLDSRAFPAAVAGESSCGCILREHGFIPTFNKWKGEYCVGWQIHVTDARSFHPVTAAVGLLAAAIETAPGAFAWKKPPYEYETEKMPIDILAGSDELRVALEAGARTNLIRESWRVGWESFSVVLKNIALYPEELS